MRATKRRVSHGRELYYILCIVALVASTIFGIWGPGGYVEMKKAQAELEALNSRVQAIERSNEERYERIRALRSDPEALEKYARQKGYVRRSEIIQQLPQEPSASK